MEGVNKTNLLTYFDTYLFNLLIWMLTYPPKGGINRIFFFFFIDGGKVSSLEGTQLASLYFAAAAPVQTILKRYTY